jgi:hypothetical protein
VVQILRTATARDERKNFVCSKHVIFSKKFLKRETQQKKIFTLNQYFSHIPWQVKKTRLKLIMSRIGENKSELAR